SFGAMTSRPKLTYFDAPVSRGEECRIALHLAGIDFEDHRINRDEWAAMKPTTPFGSLPVLELPGKPPLAQSNAILVLIGRKPGGPPTDDCGAGRHEAILQHCEDLRVRVGATMRMPDDEKQRVRADLAANFIPPWAASIEKQLSDGPFFAGGKL